MNARAAIVLDIEGTTTPISFVYDTLFPYAREHIASYLREHRRDSSVARDIDALVAQSKRDVAERIDGAREVDGSSIDDVIANVLWQMDNDRKTTALKSLQGKVWRDGYTQGSLRGAVFADVAEAMAAWDEAGKTVAIYSSGSVEAQKLLFRYSTAGDLTPHISAYFDTTTGPKRAASSYAAIAASLKLSPRDVLFATDIVEEAIAADEAGMQAVIMNRPGNHPVAAHPFPVLASFDELR